MTLRGTARWFKPEVGDLMEAKFTALVTGIAAAFGATAEAVFDRGYPATVNEPTSTRRRPPRPRRRSPARPGPGNAAPTMGGEDFSFMLNAKAGSYIMLGARRAARADVQVHHPRYDFNDAMLPVGASYWATLAEQLLPRE